MYIYWNILREETVLSICRVHVVPTLDYRSIASTYTIIGVVLGRDV